MLSVLDIILTLVHLFIILFNLFAWIPKITRKAHLVSIVLTAGSWFILGIWFGMGYCPFTDWQWRIKARLGETNLPQNFIEYFAEKVSGYDFAPGLVSTITAVSFATVALISVYMNLIYPKRRPG